MQEKVQNAEFEVMSVGNLKVKIFDSKGTQVVPVAKSTVTVGSAEHCDVAVVHSSVAPEHVRAWLEGGRVWIQDLGTHGGTFLNGIRLPPLKPMLVRDLDVLKLGESPATLNFEANMVRAPVVKPVVMNDELTPIEIRQPTTKDMELEKRREELAKVSRELAELKLQLQMARLEKSAGDELRRQLNQLREDVRAMEEQKDKADFAIKRAAEDSHATLQAHREEIARSRKAAEAEIKEMLDSAGRKLGNWKVDVVAELSKQVHQLSLQKTKAWVTRPLTSDMVREWESELTQMIRRLLLEEKAAPTGEISSPRIKTSPHDLPEQASAPTRKIRVPRPPKFKPQKGKMILLASGVLVLTLAAFGARRWSRRTPTAVAATVATRGVASVPNSLPAPNPPNLPSRFAPKQSKTFKKSYTENVLYTENYLEAETNSGFRQRWLADLTKAGREQWNLDDRSIAMLASKEAQLIQDLQHLRDGIQVAHEQEGISAMRTRETGFQRDLQTILGSPMYVEQYQRLKHSFFTRNQPYLSVRPAAR